LLAQKRSAGCIKQCPLSGVTENTFAQLNSSQFDPKATWGRS
jgi:hypothetical protein